MPKCVTPVLVDEVRRIIDRTVRECRVTTEDRRKLLLQHAIALAHALEGAQDGDIAARADLHRELQLLKENLSPIEHEGRSFQNYTATALERLVDDDDDFDDKPTSYPAPRLLH